MFERKHWFLPGLALAVLHLGVAAAAGTDPTDAPGYVDGRAFVELAGEEAVNFEVSLSSALIDAISRADPDLHELVAGVTSIHAVGLDLSRKSGGETDRTTAERARELIRATEERLRKRGWERLAMVRDGDGEVRVLVLNDNERIQGLVVMIVDHDDGQVVFANIAGELDLAKLQRIGAGFDIPGLDQIEIK